METITSRRNPISIHLKRLGSDSGYRRENEQLICDGRKLLSEAIKSGQEVCLVMTSAPIPFTIPQGVRVYSAPYELINTLSPLKNAQEVLFTCKMPKLTEFEYADGTHILLDGIQDPGNLGTIIRTADAFGISSVIMTDGCADPYNPKTIRATMGAIFRQRLEKTSAKGLMVPVKKGLRLIGAAVGESTREISEVKLTGSVLAIGSEGRGLSREIISLCSERVRIPMSESSESLNASVAASIMMWEATKTVQSHSEDTDTN